MNGVDTYHTDMTADSNSSLNLFRASVERYAAIRIHRTMQPDEATRPMIFGNAFHTLLLEPCQFEERFIGGVECDRRTTSGKLTWADFLKVSEGKVILTTLEMELLRAMVVGVLRNEFAANALSWEGGIIEKPVYWNDPLTGLPLKCRPDLLLPNGLIIDAKTTDSGIDPESWSRTMDRFAYHRAAALYLDGCNTAGIEATNFVHVVVSKEPPHECAVYEVGQESIDLGREENQRTLEELALRIDRQDWTGRWSSDLTTVNLPYWRFNRKR